MSDWDVPPPPDVPDGAWDETQAGGGSYDWGTGGGSGGGGGGGFWGAVNTGLDWVARGADVYAGFERARGRPLGRNTGRRAPAPNPINVRRRRARAALEEAQRQQLERERQRLWDINHNNGVSPVLIGAVVLGGLWLAGRKS